MAEKRHNADRPFGDVKVLIVIDVYNCKSSAYWWYAVLKSDITEPIGVVKMQNRRGPARIPVVLQFHTALWQTVARRTTHSGNARLGMTKAMPWPDQQARIQL